MEYRIEPSALPDASTALDVSPSAAPSSTATPAIESNDGLPSAQELEQTLRRLMRRVAMMIQADKCVFLLHDAGRQSLVARPPALGLTLPQVKSLRLPTERGITGKAFSTCEPIILHSRDDAEASDVAWLKRLEVRKLIA